MMGRSSQVLWFGGAALMMLGGGHPALSADVHAIGVAALGAGLKPLSTSRYTLAAAEGGHAKPEELPPDLPLPPTAVKELSPAEQYCSNVLDEATAAQLAHQKSVLEQAQRELDARIKEISLRTDELKAWIKKREDFTAQASESLVQIYGKMKPDSAARQLAVMNDFVAAAIMSKLSPKISSQILSEMDAAKAAKLSAVIASAAELATAPEERDAQH